MESRCYFFEYKECVCDKSVSSSSENGGKNSGIVAAFSEAEEKPYSSLIVAPNNSRDSSSMVDLKLGSTSDQKETLSLNSFNNSSYSVAKRCHQIPFCQVYGCKKDLRSSKDYHKRHKVCEVHSKTAKVIVNGVEQRFCQQCSRFHILAEFDNGKRSCRKRLAGHNERRRKPRVGVNSTRLGMFQDYNGSRFQGTASTSSVALHQQKYEVDNWNRPVNVEQLHSKSVSIPHTSGKQRFPLHVGENSALTRSKIDEIDQLSLQDHVECSDIGSLSLFNNSSVGCKSSMFMESSSYFQVLSEMPNSPNALSLLSSLSEDSSNPSSRALSSPPPLVTSDSDAFHDLSKVPQELLAVSSGASTTGMSRVGHSSWRPLSQHHW